MDVNRYAFQHQLPLILKAIATSRFVTFDFELSGIPGKQTGQARAPGRSEDGKQTLQERYEETKKAAERYQILQLGLTCVEEDLERGVYVTRPYNFFLNPVTDKKLEVEREFTYQSGAAEFLLGVGFRMEAPFTEGVPYLSRQEEARARSIAAARWDRTSIVDIQIPADDIGSMDFVRRVRREVREWVENLRNPSIDELPYKNIAPSGHDQPGYNGRGLNRYQKRLVHQLIRSEFPDVVSQSRFDSVCLTPYDKEREDYQLQKKVAWFETTLTSQIGLRWIAEALCPNIDALLHSDSRPPQAFGDLKALAREKWIYPPVPATDTEKKVVADQFDELLSTLRTKDTILVGHNLFLDLIYFFTCFFGCLPARVEGFQNIVAQVFPLVFDTKYLADKINDNSPLYKSSLNEIDQELSKLPIPIIETPPEHSKYETHSPAHEAGFDSFLTARVLIRLSSRTLREENGDVSPLSEEDIYETASEDGGVYLNGRVSPSKGQKIDPYALERAARSDEQLAPAEVQTDGDTVRSPFSHNNAFDLLHQLSLEDRPETLRPISKTNLSILDDPQHPAARPRPSRHKMMPPVESSFWLRYGNKLRVNGTVEEVCVIRRSEWYP